MTISRIGVIGCGQMGSGIAETCARADVDVLVFEKYEEALKAGRQRVGASFSRAVAKGKLTEDERAVAERHMRFTLSLDEFVDRQLIIEAATEDHETKIDIFRQLSSITKNGDVILASNTSSIPIAELAAATERPEQVIGMHFFNPVPVMDLVELIVSAETSSTVSGAAEHFVSTTLKKRVIHGPDRPGFIVNALLVPYLLSAMRMFEQGLATAEDIDAGMEIGCAHPMGPLKLADFIGLDTVLSIADVLRTGLDDPAAEPPALLRQLVAEGKLGKKSGQGFYGYS